MSVADVPLGPLAPRCATHEEQAASGTCARCGTFFCAACTRIIFDKAYCATCAERPDINYLERFRLELWGRRDAWAWTIGVSGLGLGVLAAVMLRDQEYPLALAFGACAGVSGAFFLGLPWARRALIGVPLLFALVCGQLGLYPIAAALAVLFLLALAVHGNTRSQLFFRRQVPAHKLQALWHLRENNPLARHALSYALSGLLLPVMAPVAIVLGALALRRVNPDAVPPIGRKGQAIAALVLGILTVLGWLGVLWPVLISLLGLGPQP
jgi:hypothetical protein